MKGRETDLVIESGKEVVRIDMGWIGFEYAGGGDSGELNRWLANVGTRRGTTRIVPEEITPDSSGRPVERHELNRNQRAREAGMRFQEAVRKARTQLGIYPSIPIRLTTLESPEVVESPKVVEKEKAIITEVRECLSAEGLLGLLCILRNEE